MNTHRCPGCGLAGVPATRVACATCWAKVSRPVQRAVYATYDGGRGLFSDEYYEAREAAVEEMRAQ